MPLNTKQQLFCREYRIDQNATQAAIRAGYSVKTAGQIGHELLKKPEVQVEISSLIQKSAQKLELTAERLDQECARIAFSDVRSLYDSDGNLKPISEWDDDAAAAVAGIDIAEEKITRSGGDEDGPSVTVESRVRKLKTWDKNAAIRTGYQRLGIFAPAGEVSFDLAACIDGINAVRVRGKVTTG